MEEDAAFIPEIDTPAGIARISEALGRLPTHYRTMLRITRTGGFPELEGRVEATRQVLRERGVSVDE